MKLSSDKDWPTFNEKSLASGTSIGDTSRAPLDGGSDWATVLPKAGLEKVELDQLRSDPTDEWLLQEWCKLIGKPFSPSADRELLRSSLFRAAIFVATVWMERILPWKWQFLRTTRDHPFIVSDWPASGTKDIGHWLLTFPISSEIAILTSSHPGVGFPHGGTVADVRAINIRTMHKAKRFVVCHKNSFPGDDELGAWLRGDLDGTSKPEQA